MRVSHAEVGLIVPVPVPVSVPVPLIPRCLARGVSFMHLRAPDLAGRYMSPAVTPGVRGRPVPVRVHHAPVRQRSGQHQGQQQSPFVRHIVESPEPASAAHAG